MDAVHATHLAVVSDTVIQATFPHLPHGGPNVEVEVVRTPWLSGTTNLARVVP